MSWGWGWGCLGREEGGEGLREVRDVPVDVGGQKIPHCFWVEHHQEIGPQGLGFGGGHGG